MPWSDFTYSTPKKVEREPGIYRCLIMNAEQSVSKSSGKNMLVITLRPSGTTANVRAYIVDNEYFDRNVSEFIDAFPALKDGFSINRCFGWRGALGAVKLIVDENGFFKTAKYPWVPFGRTENLPPYDWKTADGEPQEMPVYQGFTELEEDDSDLPFEI